MKTIKLLLRTCMQVGILCGVLASGTPAAVIVIDDDGGPGVHFTDIPPAIAAAGSWDLLVIHPGNYSAFVLDKDITLLGLAPGVVVAGGIQVKGVTSGARAVIARVEAKTCLVKDCTTPIALEELTLSGLSYVDGALRVDNSDDVRMHASVVSVPPASNGSTPGTDGSSAIRVLSGRLELVHCDVRGGRGGDCIPCNMDGGWGGDGGPGAIVASEGTLHIARSRVVGGDGGDAAAGFLFVGSYGGSGGSGLVVNAYPYLTEASALLTGRKKHVFQGGDGGWDTGWSGNGQSWGGYGLRVRSMGRVRKSGVTFLTGAGNPFGPIRIDTGGYVETAVPDDPTLFFVGTPEPGKNLTFRVEGPAGAQVRLVLGRHAQLIEIPGLEEDILVTRDRVFQLGSISVGVVGLNFLVPSFLPQGFTFFAQAEMTLANGTIRRTNSVPIVLR